MHRGRRSHLQLLRADQDPWRITDRGPSPRNVIALLRRWWTLYSRQLLAIVNGPPGDVPTSRELTEVQSRLQIAPPVAMSGKAYARAAVPITARASRQAIAGLLRAGLPPVEVDRRLGVVPTSPFAVDIEGIDLLRSLERDALTQWARDGLGYINAVPTRQLEGLDVLLTEAITQGKTWRTLRRELRGQLAVSRRHLDLIARDQTAKLNGRITQAMHAGAGVRRYRWRANLDERTRASHVAAHGLIVDWASPGVPGTGFYGEPAHAGQAGQCRCTAEPIVEF